MRHFDHIFALKNLFTLAQVQRSPLSCAQGIFFAKFVLWRLPLWPVQNRFDRLLFGLLGRSVHVQNSLRLSPIDLHRFALRLLRCKLFALGARRCDHCLKIDTQLLGPHSPDGVQLIARQFRFVLACGQSSRLTLRVLRLFGVHPPFDEHVLDLLAARAESDQVIFGNALDFKTSLSVSAQLVAQRLEFILQRRLVPAVHFFADLQHKVVCQAAPLAAHCIKSDGRHHVV